MVSKGQETREDARFEKEIRFQAFRMELRDRFGEFDRSGDGVLERWEFQLAIPSIISMVEHEESTTIHTESDLMTLFDMIDFDGKGSVDIDEFIAGMDQFNSDLNQAPLALMKMHSLHTKRHTFLEKELRRFQSKLTDYLQESSIDVSSLPQKDWNEGTPLQRSVARRRTRKSTVASRPSLAIRMRDSSLRERALSGLSG